MNVLLTGLMTKLSSSDLESAVGGRIYLDQAPDNCEFPYCVFFIVVATPNDTFTDHLDDVIIQFSLFSASSSAAEITDMYGHLKALFDDCTFTLSSGTLISMGRENLTTMMDEITVSTGVVGVKHWAVDYRLRMHYA
jgi:hypothetical protein